MARRILLCGLLAMAAWCSAASAIPVFGDAWEARYPLSTLPARMAALTGSVCNVCHHAGPGTQGNCYRDDLSDLLVQGLTPTDAIAQLDSVDSDGDGVPNGVEITAAREGEPGEIGYNPGLIGDTGTDPCADYPDEEVTGVPETPPPPLVPTVSEWGLAAMVMLLMSAGSIVIARRRLAA